jgi:beta-phosphoglucomutase
MITKKAAERGVIFDMDGVIINSNPYLKIAWTNFLNRRNVEVEDDVFRDLIFGRTGEEALIVLLNDRYSKNELVNFCNEIDSEYRDIIRKSKNVKPVNGLLEFIKSISDKGYKIALATSAPPENVDLILNKFGILKYFNLIIDKTQITESKPNPEIYLKAVRQLGLNKVNCIVFEDSISGIQSAKNAGLLVVGITTSQTNNELIDAGATICIKDFFEIASDDLDKLTRDQKI